MREGMPMDWKMLGKIVVAWVITVPAAALMTVALYFLLMRVFIAER
jgi:phosphate/sulfate permease